MRQQRQSNWKLVLICMLFAAALFADFWFLRSARAEEMPCWVMCQPDSWVNARMNPKKKSMEIGKLECGDQIWTDGKLKNGFLHVYGLWFELDEGWVHKGYIVFDEPYVPVLQDTHVISNGRVAARRTIDGKRRCWLRNGQSIFVYMMTDEWAVTNKGFVKSRFIDQGF